MTRKEARDNGFKIIFEYAFQKESAEALLNLFYELNPEITSQAEYLNDLVKTTLENCEAIDALIIRHAKGWTFNRISKVSLSALRVGICELIYNDEVPDSIAINEAVELAKTYEDQKAGAFVNGILSTIVKGKQE